jgi:hypothetical protein
MLAAIPKGAHHDKQVPREAISGTDGTGNEARFCTGSPSVPLFCSPHTGGSLRLRAPAGSCTAMDIIVRDSLVRMQNTQEQCPHLRQGDNDSGFLPLHLTILADVQESSRLRLDSASSIV